MQLLEKLPLSKRHLLSIKVALGEIEFSARARGDLAKYFLLILFTALPGSTVSLFNEFMSLGWGHFGDELEPRCLDNIITIF